MRRPASFVVVVVVVVGPPPRDVVVVALPPPSLPPSRILKLYMSAVGVNTSTPFQGPPDVMSKSDGPSYAYATKPLHVSDISFNTMDTSAQSRYPYGVFLSGSSLSYCECGHPICYNNATTTGYKINITIVLASVSEEIFRRSFTPRRCHIIISANERNEGRENVYAHTTHCSAARVVFYVPTSVNISGTDAFSSASCR